MIYINGLEWIIPPPTHSITHLHTISLYRNWKRSRQFIRGKLIIIIILLGTECDKLEDRLSFWSHIRLSYIFQS